MSDFQQYVRPGKGRVDLSLLFLDPAAYTAAMQAMAAPFESMQIDKVVGLDAMGFLFASRVSEILNVGLILFRKEGKVPIEKETIAFTDYTNTAKVFEVVPDAIKPGDRLLIVDEWSETGSQLKAAIALAQRLDGVVVGATCFNIDKPVREDVELSAYTLHSVL